MLAHAILSTKKKFIRGFIPGEQLQTVDTCVYNRCCNRKIRCYLVGVAMLFLKFMPIPDKISYQTWVKTIP